MKKSFDCVVMLTMSDWKTEPRSNRYHYAVRFAKDVTTFFVQFDNWSNQVEIENTEHENLYIIHAPYALCEYDSKVPLDTTGFADLELVINKLGGRNRLIWLYNPYCHYLLDQWARYYKVYHATEIYMIREPKFSHVNNDQDYIRLGNHMKRTLASCDLVISVATGAEETIRSFVEYKGDILRLHNGCDHKFWIRPETYLGLTGKKQRPKTIAAEKTSVRRKSTKTVFYQGGVNHRLDFDLLSYAADALPDWKFVLCGQKWLDKCGPSARQFLKRPNVEYLGMLGPEEIRKEAAKASVATIPFVESYSLRNSLPLKAYEYVACGLPVVTTPINDLLDRPDLFDTAFSKEQFVEKIQLAARTRYIRKKIANRLRAARNHSYDKNYKQLVEQLEEKVTSVRAGKKLNILVLYCEKSTANRGLRVSLEAIKQYSKHNIYFLKGTNWGQSPPYIYVHNQAMTDSLLEEYGDDRLSIWDLNIFDAVVVHYSVRLTFDFIFSDFICRQLEKFNGPKFLYIQDEYEKTEMARKWMDFLQFDVIYTCVPDPYIEKIYPKQRFPATRFTNVLTGYVTDDLKKHKAVALEGRKIAIAYRGRKLSHRYGRLGYEKREIGIKVREYAEENNIPVDIEWEDKYRIYDQWLEFLGSARATLATESGSNMFDFDGSLNEKALQWADVEFDEAYEEFFGEYDNYINMAQISPKVFEAISVKTALICFKGNYSGMIKPDIHYIPLEKDFSNIEEVFQKLMDDNYVRKMTERAYNDIILSGKYDIERNVELLDTDIDAHAGNDEPYEIISAPVAVKKGQNLKPLYRSSPVGFMLNDIPINLPGFSRQFLDAFEGMTIQSENIGSRPKPEKLLYTELTEFSKYDKKGNFVDPDLREHRMIARIQNWKPDILAKPAEEKSPPKPAAVNSQPVNNVQQPVTALDRLIMENRNNPPVVEELNNLLRLERYSKLSSRADEILNHSAASVEMQKQCCSHLVQFLALFPVTEDEHLKKIINLLADFLAKNPMVLELDRLYDFEFVLRKNNRERFHAEYMRTNVDTMIANETKPYEPRLYMGIYYYFQLYYADEKINEVRKIYKNGADHLYKRMIDFGKSWEEMAKKYDEERNVDNSYMARLFNSLTLPPVTENAPRKANKAHENGAVHPKGMFTRLLGKMGN